MAELRSAEVGRIGGKAAWFSRIARTGFAVPWARVRTADAHDAFPRTSEVLAEFENVVAVGFWGRRSAMSVERRDHAG
jgi:hypothetical protein